MTTEEIEGILNKIRKAEILTAKLEGRKYISGTDEDYTTIHALIKEGDTRRRITQFCKTYRDEGTTEIGESVLWILISKYKVKVSLKRFKKFCEWVLGDE